MEKMKQIEYLAPDLMVLQFNVEQGFAATGDPGHAGGNLGENDPWSW